MSNNVFPVPSDTPFITQKGDTFFGDVWNRFFKYLGDDVVGMSLARNARNTKLKYVMLGCLCYCVWYDPTNTAAVTLDLPFTSLLAFDVDGTIYAPGTTQITTASSYATFTFVANFKEI